MMFSTVFKIAAATLLVCAGPSALDQHRQQMQQRAEELGVDLTEVQS